LRIFFLKPEYNMAIDIKLPVEVDLSGLVATINAQGELVTYSGIDFAVTEATSTCVAAQFAGATLYKEGADADKVQVDLSGGFYEARVAAALKASLNSIADAALTGPHADEMSGVGAGLAISNASKHFDSYALPAQNGQGVTMDAFLKRHIYNYLIHNLGGQAVSSVLVVSEAGIAALGNDMNIDWDDTDADLIASKLKDALTTAANSAFVRQSIYEQMLQSAPSRLTAQHPATDVAGQGVDSEYRQVPFESGDSLAFLIKFIFAQPAVNVGSSKPFSSNTTADYTSPSSKITVANPATAPISGLPAPGELYCMLKLEMTA
jgi:hypothetical protein